MFAMRLAFCGRCPIPAASLVINKSDALERPGGFLELRAQSTPNPLFAVPKFYYVPGTMTAAQTFIREHNHAHNHDTTNRN